MNGLRRSAALGRVPGIWPAKPDVPPESRWPVRKFRLADEPGPDLSATTTADQRLAMMWPLARDAWTLAGRTIPDYPRARMPVRVVRLAGDRSSD